MRAVMLIPLAALLTIGAAPPQQRPLCEKPGRSAGHYCTLVFFEYDSSEIAPSAWPILDTVIGEVADNDGARVVLTGHTDRVHTRDYAIGRSQRMANSVRDYLVGHGIKPEAISTEAYGAERPRVKAAAGRREPANRRVEIWVIE